MAQRKKRLDKDASGRQHVVWGRSIWGGLKAHLTIDDDPDGKHLTDAERAALAAEEAVVRGLVERLQANVAPYRDFVEGAFLEVRAEQRVADFLVDEAQRRADGAVRPVRGELEPLVAGGIGAFFGGFALSRVVDSGRALTIKLARDGAALFGALPARFAFAADVAQALERTAGLLERYYRRELDGVAPRRRPLKSAVERSVRELRDGLEQMDGRLRQTFSQLFIESLYPTLSKDGARVADAAEEGDAPDDGTAGAES